MKKITTLAVVALFGLGSLPAIAEVAPDPAKCSAANAAIPMIRAVSTSATAISTFNAYAREVAPELVVPLSRIGQETAGVVRLGLERWKREIIASIEEEAKFQCTVETPTGSDKEQPTGDKT